MKILFDTHIFIWWFDAPERLSAALENRLADAQNEIFLSVASVWEMQIKISIGKLTLSRPLPEILAENQTRNGLQIVPISLAHMWQMGTLPHLHNDPFDRLLIAQTQTENFHFATVDTNIARYDVQVLA